MEEWQKQLEINHTLSFFDNEKNKKLIVDSIMKSIDKKPEPKVWFDEETELMWQIKIDASDEHGRYHWDDIFNYKDNLNKGHYGGYHDWRIPTFSELQTLMTEKSHPNFDSSDEETFIKKPLLNSMIMKYGRFWSKTENEKNKDLAFGVNFNRVRDNSLSKCGNKEKYKTRYVRCVRLWRNEGIQIAWNNLDSSDTQGLNIFLNKYPNSKYDDLAHKALEKIEQEEKNYLNSLSPFQKKLLHLREKDKSTPKITLLLKGIKEGVFEAEKEEALIEVKKLMQDEGKWKESSAKKNPMKDKEYQRTLEVILLQKSL
jgi:hypothetical protein